MTIELDQVSIGLVCGFFRHQHPLFDNLLQQLPNVIVVKNNISSCISKILSMIVVESQGEESHQNFLLNRLTESLFYILIRQHLDTEKKGMLVAMSHPKLKKTMNLIHGNKQKNSIDDLAMAAGVSRSAFSVLFKDVVGLTPNDYGI